MIELVAAAAIATHPGRHPEASYSHQVVCSAHADGPDGSRMVAKIRMSRSGRRFVGWAVWNPPRRAGSQPAAESVAHAPALEISYDLTAGGRLTRVTYVSATVAARDVEGREDAKVRLSLDGAPYISTELYAFDHPNQREGLFSDDDTETGAPPLSASVSAAHAVMVTLVSADGRVLGAAAYDLSASAERNQLLATARLKVNFVARHPWLCPRVPPPPKPIPIPLMSPMQIMDPRPLPIQPTK